MIDALKKSYEQNRALLKRGKAFERMKDYYHVNTVKNRSTRF